jgi:Recombination endonuclease VII
MNCTICGKNYERRGKRGPLSKRCPECCDSDKRQNRKPKGSRSPHPCAACGAETTAKTMCVPCAAERRKKSIRAWHEANPGKALEAHRKHAAKFPWKFRKRFSVFGVTEAEFDAMLAGQGGKCAICETTDPGVHGWNLDHDHSFSPKDRAGHRGVLCRACNLMLGNAKDDPRALQAAIVYLLWHAKRVKAA